MEQNKSYSEGCWVLLQHTAVDYNTCVAQIVAQFVN